MNNAFQTFAQATVAPGVRQRTAEDYQQTVQSPQPTANIQQQQSGVQQPTSQDLLGNGNARISVPQNQSTGVAVAPNSQGGISWIVWLVVGIIVVTIIVRVARLKSRPMQRNDAQASAEVAEGVIAEEPTEEPAAPVSEKPAEIKAGSVKKKRKSKSKRKKR